MSTNIIYKDSGRKDGEVGVQFSVNTNAQKPTLIFRRQDASNYLCIKNDAGTYKLIENVGGTEATLRSYVATPANEDFNSVRYIGPNIEFLLDGASVGAFQTNRFLEKTGVGLGSDGTTVRFDYFYTTDGKERLLEVITSGAWAEIRNKLETADYPTKVYVDPANRLHFWPAPNYFVRVSMQYQQQLADLVAGASPDMTSDFHPILSNMVADKLSLFTGRRVLGKDCERRWKEELPLAIASHNDQGDVIGDYDE